MSPQSPFSNKLLLLYANSAIERAFRLQCGRYRAGLFCLICLLYALIILAPCLGQFGQLTPQIARQIAAVAVLVAVSLAVHCYPTLTNYAYVLAVAV